MARRPFKHGRIYTGPYELWIFGDGAKYAVAPDDPDEKQALVGVGEWKHDLRRIPVHDLLPRGLDPFEEAGEDDQPDERRVRVTAAIASPPDRLRDKLKFLPLVFWRKDRRHLASAPWDGLEDVADTLSEENFTGPDLEEEAGGEHHRNAALLRVNIPISFESFNPEFDPERDAPVRKLPAVETKLAEAGKELVVIGVIDDGLPFAHGNFLGTDNATRVDFCWIQGARRDGPSEVAFGAEVTGETIDELRWRHSENAGSRPAHSSAAQTDEDAVYADPDAMAVSNDEEIGRNIFRNYTHGAHVMDRAAGFRTGDNSHEDGDLVRVVGVQLPRGALRDTSGFGKDVFILAGVHYVLDRAERIAAEYGAERVRVLVNVSLGITGGPKNGRYQLERALDDLADAYSSSPDTDGIDRLGEISITLPTGNNYASQLSAELAVPIAGNFTEIGWRIQTNDRTPNYVEMWLDDPGDASLEDIEADLGLVLVTPAGEELRMSAPERAPTLTASPVVLDGETIGQMSIDRYAGLIRYMAVIAPTEHEATWQTAEAPNAPAGLWTLKLERPLGAQIFTAGETIHCLIQRDEDPAGTHNGGRQSYFDIPARFIDDPEAYRPYNERGRRIAQATGNPISGYWTINGWATRGSDAQARHRLAIAGFTAGRKPDGTTRVVEPALYSAAGHRSANTDPRVDYALMSDRSVALAGVAGAGSRTGATTVLVGTSSAAPAYIRARVLEALSGVAPSPLDPQTERLGQPLDLVRR